MTDAWNPDQYHRFREQRRAPFFDLLNLVQPGVGRVVDLGCGSGELTALLAERTGATDTVGIDRSAAMLTEAQAHERPGLRFEEGDLAKWGDPADPVDLVFANAALQWVPDHAAVLERWAGALRPGGQLAVQVPANVDHPSHRLSAEVATEEPFRSALGGTPPPDPVLDVLAPEQYAELLYCLGFVEQHVRLQVYGHVLASTTEVVEWVKGTSLTRFQRLLSPALFDAFVDRYRNRLLDELGSHTPYFYAFKRILFWARR